MTNLLQFLVTFLIFGAAHGCFTKTLREGAKQTEEAVCSRPDSFDMPLPLRKGKAIYCFFAPLFSRLGKRSVSSSEMSISEKPIGFDITITPEQYDILFSEDNTHVTVETEVKDGILYGKVKDVVAEPHALGSAMVSIRQKRNIVQDGEAFPVEITVFDDCRDPRGCEFVGQYAVDADSPKLRLRRSTQLEKAVNGEGRQL